MTLFTFPSESIYPSLIINHPQINSCPTNTSAHIARVVVFGNHTTKIGKLATTSYTYGGCSIEMGAVNFAALSEETVIPGLHRAKLEKRLVKFQRQLARRQQGSAHWWERACRLTTRA